MASAVKYLSNVTKSIKYAAVDVFKELNPVIVEGVEENKDIAKVTYASIKNFKKSSTKAMGGLSNSQIGELAREAKKNLIEDLKSGKFYNREREARIEGELADKEFSDDYSEFMADDSDLGFDTDSNEFLADSMDEVGEKASSAVNQVLVRTAEYQVEANRQSTTRLLAQTSAMTATLHGDLAAVNANLAGVVKFNQEAMATHIENSRMFYERQQQQMSEQISLLTEIRDIQKSVFMPEKASSSNDRIGIGDIFTANGFLNFGEYFKYIKQNIKDQDTGMGDMIKMVMDMGLGKTFAANPLGSIMKFGVKAAIPKVLKNAMADFNEAIAGSISTALLNITKQRGSMNPIMSMIGNILGLDLNQKSSLDTSAYNKGATAWTGKDHKALTEVIPTLLSKIYSSVSGKEEVRYDYEGGRFNTYGKIKRDFQAMQDRYVREANDSILPYLQEQIDKVDFGGNAERTQEFLDTLETILKHNFKNMEKFNPRDKSITAKTYGLKGEHAEYDLELIRSMYEQIPKNKQLKNQQDLIEAVQSMNRNMAALQETGDSKYNALFDGSMGKDFGSRKSEKETSVKSPIASGFNKLDITNNILLDIRNRLFMSKTGKKGKKSNNKVLAKSIEDYVTTTGEAIDDKKEENRIKSSLGLSISSTKDKKTMSIDSDVDLEVKEEEKSLINNIKKATTATDKIKALFKGGSLLFTKPAEFMSGVLKKVDNRLYNLLFSEDDNVDGSIMDKIKEGFNNWFDGLKDWAKAKLDGIKESIEGEGIKGKFSSIMKNLFGFDFESWEAQFKEALFGDKDTSLVGGLRDLFKKGFKEIFDGFRKFFKGENPEEQAKRADNDAAKTTRNALRELLGSTDKGEPNAAGGTKRVDKTGLIAVSEGEMIIPPDYDPAKIKKREEEEDKIIKKYESIFGESDILGYAAGGVVGDEDSNDDMYIFLKNKIKEGWTTNQVKKWADEHIKDPEARKKLYDQAVSQVREYTKNKASKLTKKVMNFGGSMIDEAKKIGQEAMENETINNLFSKIANVFSNNKAMPGEGKAAVADVVKNFRDYLPRVAAGGVAGAGLSLILGLAGGPILGAAVGAGVGILSKSEKLKKWLFGDKIVDENGKTHRDGSGILPKDIVDKAQKYFPGIAKGAIVGGITSVLPFVPGGPIVGILVGSATGFALSTDKVRNALFGEEGKLTKAKDVLKKKLPRMGLGAAAGAVIGGLAGPFGLVTNMMIGAGIGLVSDTEKFKDIVFGTKGFDGKRAGGLVGFIKDAFEIPINGVKNLFKGLKGWFEENILEPIKKGLSPFIQQAKNIGNWIKDAITNAFRDHVAKPIGAFVNDKILKPIQNVLGRFIKNFILRPIGAVISAPFKAFGAVGQALEKRQLRRVGAAAGSASTRIQRRKELDKDRNNPRYTNTQAQQVDEFVVGATNEELLEYQMLGEVAQSQRKLGGGKRAREKAIKNYAEGLASKSGLDKLLLSHVNRSPRQLSVDDYKFIMNEVIEGDYRASISLIMGLGSFPQEYKKAACKKIKDTALQIREARAKARNYRERAQEIKDRTGVDITSGSFNRVIGQEVKDRGLNAKPEEKTEDTAQTEAEKSVTHIPNILKDNHDELMKTLNKMADSLEKIANPSDKRKSKAERRKQKRAKQDAKAIEKDNRPLDEIDELLAEEDAYVPNFVQVGSEEDKPSAAAKRSRAFANTKNRLKDAWSNFRDSSPLERLSNIFTASFDSLMNQRTTTPGITDIVATAQNGNYADAMKMVNGKNIKPGMMKRIARNVVNKIRRKSTSSGTVMTENGPILMRKDSKGNDIPDTRDSETKETLALRDENQNTQKGILAKLSGIGDGLKGFFGFGQDDDDETDGPFKKIFKNIAKFALPVLGVIGGLAGIGLAKKIGSKKIQVQQKDAQGNKLYDENGNPIMIETTIGEVIKSKIKEVWLGEDGTGNTSGIWFHIKKFATDTIFPAVKAGFNVITDKLPELIQTGVSVLIQNAPVLFGAIISGIAKGTVSLFKKALSKLPIIGNFFKDKEDKDKPTSSEIEKGTSSNKTVTLKVNSAITGSKASTGGTTGSTTFSSNTSSVVGTASSTGTVKGAITTEDQAASTVQTVAEKTAPNYSSSDSASTGTANITAQSAEPGDKKEINRSLAFQNASPAIRNKALGSFKNLWNTQVLSDGTTLAELCNDDQTVLAEIQDNNGNVVQVTGADILTYPDIATQLLGINLSFTDEERDENSKYVRSAIDTNPANWAGVKMLVTGGKYGKGTLKAGSKLVKGYGRVAQKIGVKAGRFIQKGPGGLFKAVGAGLELTGRATNAAAKFSALPLDIMEKGRRVLNDYSDLRGLGYSRKGAASMAGKFERTRVSNKIKESRDAFNATMESRKAARTGGKGLSEKAKNFAKNTIDDIGQKIGNKAYDAAEKVNSITSSDIKKASSGVKSAMSKLRGKSKVANKAASGLEKLGSKAKTLGTNMGILLNKFFSNNKIIQAVSKVVKCGKGASKVASKTISEALEKFSKTILEKFTKGLAKVGAKVIAKVSAKIAAYIGSAGIVAAAFIVIDFIRGMTKADAIMGVEKPTVAERLIAGLINAFAETFFITLVVDTSTLTQLIIDFLEALGVNMDKLRARQQEAEENCAQYNAEHGTNYTVEEYLMSDHLGTRIKAALKAKFSIKGRNSSADLGEDNTEQEISRKEKRENRRSTRQSRREERQTNRQERRSNRKAKRQERRANRRGGGTTATEESIVTDIATSPEYETSYIDAGDVTGGVSTADYSTSENYTELENTASVKGNITTDATASGMEEFSSDAVDDATSGRKGIISNKNRASMNQLRAEVNSSIPKMIALFKARLAAYFGLNASDIDKTGNKMTVNSNPVMFFKALNSMWRMTNIGVIPLFARLPKAIKRASSNMSHFLAVSFGLADPNETTISLEDATTDAYLNRRAQTIRDTSVFGSLLAGTSVTGSNSADENAQSNALDEKNETTKKSNGLLSKVRNFVSKIFGGGSGSGLSGRPDEYGDIPDADRSNVETFISQKYSKYAGDSFTVKGDQTRETVADAGCAPAAATMAINTLGTVEPIDMNTAMKDAIKYKKPNGGVTADYFIDEFDKHGLQASYVAGNTNDKETIIMNQLRRGNPIILMGQDESNGSKTISPFGPKTHYVVATGISNDGRQIYINDPEARRPRIPYSVNKVMKGTILGVAPLAKTKSISGAVNNKAKKILSQFGGSGKYDSSTVQYKVWNGLRAAGYNEFTTAAAMGNIEHESGFDTSAIEKGSGAGFGLVQWTGGRRTSYENYAKSLGKDPSDLNTQIQYLITELEAGSGIWTKGSTKYGFGVLTRDDWVNAASVNDIEKATKAFMCCFERPAYSSSTNHIDRRIDSAYTYYQEFTGTQIDPSLLSTSGTTGNTGAESATNSVFQNILNMFTELGSAYGITSSTDSTSGSSGGSVGSAMATGEVSGAVSSNAENAAKQRQLVLEMKGIQNTLPYSQSKRDVENDKSGDCSSTVQWAYKKVLGVDPGVNTTSQYSDEDTYTVTTSLNDPSKLQLGDLLLRKGHVEMYAGLDENGNHIMIGHGGASHTLPDGTKTTKGPFIRKLAETPPYNMVRRWTGFKQGGSGSGLGDSIDDKSNVLTRSKNNTIYNRKWIVGGSGTGITSDSTDQPSYQVSTTTSTATPASRGSSTMVSASSSSNGSGTMDKLIQVVIGLLSQVVNNTSAIKDISTLLVKLLDLKSSSTGSGLTDDEKTYISNEMGLMKALIAQSYDSNQSSEDENLAKLIRNVEAIAQL